MAGSWKMKEEMAASKPSCAWLGPNVAMRTGTPRIILETLRKDTCSRTDSQESAVMLPLFPLKDNSDKICTEPLKRQFG